MERELQKLQANLKKNADDHQKIVEQNSMEFMQLKQEKENEIAKLKGRQDQASKFALERAQQFLLKKGHFC